MGTCPEKELERTRWEQSGAGPNVGPDVAALARPGPEHAPDLALVRDARADRGDARERFVERLRCIPRILTARNARLGHPLGEDELADLCQETFSVVWAKADTYAGRARLETWVARYCVFLLLNSLRRKQRRVVHRLVEDPPSRGPGTHDPTQLEDTRRQLHGALERLPEETARIIHWRLLDKLEFEHIARELEVPVNTAKTRFYRGMERLRTLLRGTGEEEGR